MTLTLCFALAPAQAQNDLPKKQKKAAEATSPAGTTKEDSQNESSEVVTEAKAYNGMPILQFNTQGSAKKSSDQNSFSFKVPVDEKALADDKMANPMKTQTSEKPFQTYIGYPKQQFNVSYAPNSYGGKFSFSGTEYNFSSSNTTGVNLVYRFIPTPSTVFEADGSYFTASTNAGNPGVYTVNSSTSSATTLFVRGNYCYIGDNFFARVCPGLEFGRDQYTLLGFKDNSTLEMQQASELSVGANLLMQYPIVKSVIVKARLGYLMGTGSGQSGELTSKKNNLAYLKSDLEWPISEHRLVNIGFNYSNRTASVEGLKGTSSEKWDTTVGQFDVKLGYTWEFEN